MNIGEEVARVQRLSDQELLAGLSGVLGSSRKLIALLVAHLAEVDERRLHLLAGSESMFAYCTRRLGMSEDEACRRIDVARLARRFPAVFERLATGQVSLSVAALLKPRLHETNHLELLNAVSGKTVEQAREVLAAWFPRPDVAPSIRKLPERRGSSRSGGPGESAPRSTPPFEWVSPDATPATPPGPDADAASAPAALRAPASIASIATPPAPPTTRLAPCAANELAHVTRSPCVADGAAARCAIEPLSPERYKVSFTADADLKRKLELARDLLRHALPKGDLAEIIGRALDLLLEKTLQRKFGQKSRRAAARETAPASAAVPATPTNPEPHQGAEPRGAPDPTTANATSRHPADELEPPTPPIDTTTDVHTAANTRHAHPQHSRHLSNDIRRAVLERDGLRCAWTGPDGSRCESRAWLEHDHALPRALGGGHDAANIRHYCRAHNQLAAERAYGRHAIERIIARRRARTDRHPRPT